MMPNFGPAQELLGFIELVQADDLSAAEEHFQRAIELEPENQWYLLPLARAQLRSRDPEAARRTLEPLRLPYVEEKLRATAEEELAEIDRETGSGTPGRQ